MSFQWIFESYNLSNEFRDFQKITIQQVRKSHIYATKKTFKNSVSIEFNPNYVIFYYIHDSRDKIDVYQI